MAGGVGAREEAGASCGGAVRVNEVLALNQIQPEPWLIFVQPNRHPGSFRSNWMCPRIRRCCRATKVKCWLWKKLQLVAEAWVEANAACCLQRERVLDWQPTGPNPLDHRDDYSRPALRHGSLNSRFPSSLISTFLVPARWQQQGENRLTTAKWWWCGGAQFNLKY